MPDLYFTPRQIRFALHNAMPTILLMRYLRLGSYCGIPNEEEKN